MRLAPRWQPWSRETPRIDANTASSFALVMSNWLIIGPISRAVARWSTAVLLGDWMYPRERWRVWHTMHIIPVYNRMRFRTLLFAVGLRQQLGW